MYTIETLIKINALFHEEHRVQQSDVDTANKYIGIIEKSRTNDAVQVGDIIEFTTRHGNYYRNAHVEKFEPETQEWNICEQGTPFIMSLKNENIIRCLTSGGAWDNVPDKLKLLGSRKKFFMVSGHNGACGHGAIYFEAAVNVWEYKEPEPLYGGYTTKEYDKYYISYCVDSRGYPKDGIYRYTGNGMAFQTTADYEAWRDTFRGVEFDGNCENQKVIFTYKRIKRLITEQEYKSLALPVDTRICNGTIKVKVRYDDDKRTVTEYRYTNSGNEFRELKPYILARHSLI